MRDFGALLALAERGRRLERPDPTGTGGWRIYAAGSNMRSKVRVYGYIGDSWWDDGVTAADFVRELDAIGPDGIDLHLNSGGGSVFDAVAMHAALVNHPSDIVTYVDGIAASAASFLAMAGDEIVIEKPAKMMIHNALVGYGIANKRDLRELADVLEELDGTIAQMYADRSGRPVAEFADAMDRETWYGSAAAVAAGLADRVANDTTAAPEDRRSQLIRARARVTLEGRGSR
jgi:ATP-dependent protease ClpP protease subunit